MVGQLKLVDPGNAELMRGEDGLFRQLSGQDAEFSETVRLVSGAVEGSNVNPVHEMVAMIDLQRQFEMQVKMIKTAEENDRASASLMRIS